MVWHTAQRTWVAGDWSIQLRDDELADITYAGRPVARSVRAVYRDQNWSTPTLIIENIEESAESVTISGTFADVALSCSLAVRASEHELRIDVELTPGETLQTNRTGLILLNYPHLAGTPLTIGHADGTSQDTVFPQLISPHQPAFDIAELTWQHDGLRTTATFAGDVFEMEDQRNWTDASYKTYNRPLALDFPYAITASEPIRQSIVFTAEVVGPKSTPTTERITLAGEGIFPQISVAASTAPDPAPDFEPIGSEVLVELDLATNNWRAALTRAASSTLPLDVRLIVTDLASIDDAVAALSGTTIARVTAFRAAGLHAHISDAELIAALRAALDNAKITTEVIGGTRAHFTELNREVAHLAAGLNGVTFSLTPLFHSDSTAQLVESVAMQRLVAEQARTLANNAPLHIGPIMLRPRFNNVATDQTAPPQTTDLSTGYGAHWHAEADDRINSTEMAAWTIASAAALAIPGVRTLTYAEEWGDHGLHDVHRSPRPIAHAVAAIAALGGAPLLHGNSTADGLVWAVGASTVDGEKIYVANIGTTERVIEIASPTQTHTVSIAPGSWKAISGA